jgi:hypothetical protein
LHKRPEDAKEMKQRVQTFENFYYGFAFLPIHPVEGQILGEPGIVKSPTGWRITLGHTSLLPTSKG